MNRSGLLLGVAAVLAGTTALLVVLGAVYNVFLVALALPFGAAAAFLWYDATGRLAARMRERTRRKRVREDRGTGRAAGGGARTGRTAPGGRRGPAPEPDAGPTEREARRVLGVDPDSGEEAIRRAYRERAKEVHPDAADGDEKAFKRVTAAYDRLRE